MIAQQIVFGYSDGHRRLGGSAELDKDAASGLLGATDASIGPRTKRLITALPLPSVGLYALCGTWPAPESGRPGAVWAHALLVPLKQLGDLDNLEILASTLRRPSRDGLADFARPLQIRADAPLPQQSSDPALIAQVLAAATEPEGVPVVAARDLVDGEAALFALWDSAWPELRAMLSFRTRERVKAAPQLPYICVARRVTGMWRPHAAAARAHATALAESSWVSELATPASDQEGREGDLRAFLRVFGSEGPPRVAYLVSLAELHEFVRRGEARRVARMLATEHKKATDAPGLKRALFGRRHSAWWDVAEIDVILAVLRVRGRSFNLSSLELPPRVRRLVARGRAIELIEACPRSGAKRLRSILLEALVNEASPSLLCDVMNADPALGQGVARARTDLLERTETWSIATADQAGALAATVELSDRAIAAAILAGRFPAVAPVVPLHTAALRLARARELRALRKLFDHRAPAEAFAGEGGDELRIQLAAAGVDTGSVAELLDALESRRNGVDEAWLGAAVHALVDAENKRQRAALEVVFGPLHRAITDDRLPPELLAQVGKIAPPARDPAARLRRLLIVRARDEGWSRKALERALRDSGPHVKELKEEIGGDDDDRFVAATKAALKAWKNLIG